MGILSFIGSLFKPAVDLIDELHVSEEERGKLHNELASIQAGANAKIIELERARLEAMQKIQSSESASKFWLTATWRPLCCLVIVTLIVLGSFGVVKVGPEIYELANVFLGVYGGGRTIEKIASVTGLGKK